MSHVFISYVPVDRDFASHLFRRLAQINIPVVDSMEVRAWDDWREGTDRVIEEAFALIVIMSPDAQVSEYVTYEWAYALGLRKLVIPLLLEPTSLHPRLQAQPQFDFTRDFLPWDELIRQLKQAEIDYSANKLVQALNDHQWETRMVAAEILGRKGDPSVVPSLAKSLYDNYLEVRIMAAEALGKIGDRAAVPQLVESLFNNEIEVRIACAWALGKIKDPTAVPGLVKVLRDSNTRIRWNAAWALGEIGVAAVPGLVEALRDKDGRVRGTAIGALAAIGVSDAVPGLLQALNDEKWTVREAAARALGQMQDPAAVHGLIEALHDPDDRVRGTASGALAAIGAPAVVALAAVLRDESSVVRIAAAGALGVMAYKTSVPGLFEVLYDALQDGDSGVRAVAAWALGELGAEAVPALAQALNDRDTSVRAAALRALLRIEAPEARAAIDQWQRE